MCPVKSGREQGRWPLCRETPNYSTKHNKRTSLPVPELFRLWRVDSGKLGEEHTDDVEEDDEIDLWTGPGRLSDRLKQGQPGSQTGTQTVKQAVM